MQALKEYFKRVFQDMVMMKISLPAIMKRTLCQMLEKLKTLNEYLLFLTDFILEQFQVYSKIEQKPQSSHILPAPTHAQPHSLSTFPNRAMHLLHTDITITQSPQLTSQFSLGAVHPKAFDKCVTTCIHHYRITHSKVVLPP